MLAKKAKEFGHHAYISTSLTSQCGPGFELRHCAFLAASIPLHHLSTQPSLAGEIMTKWLPICAWKGTDPKSGRPPSLHNPAPHPERTTQHLHCWIAPVISGQLLSTVEKKNNGKGRKKKRAGAHRPSWALVCLFAPLHSFSGVAKPQPSQSIHLVFLHT